MSAAAVNKFGQLVQRVWIFVNKHKILLDRFKDVTCGKFVCTVRPIKAKPNSTILTLGGDCINCPNDCKWPTVASKDTSKQCHIHKCSKIHDIGHQQLLPWYFLEASLVHPSTHQWFPQRNYPWVQTNGESDSREFSLHWSVQRHVRLTTDRDPGTGVVKCMPWDALVFTKAIVHVLCKHEWLPIQLVLAVDDCSWIHGRGLCTASGQCIKTKLHNFNGQGISEIHWAYHQLGLQWVSSAHICLGTWTKLWHVSTTNAQTNDSICLTLTCSLNTAWKHSM